MQSKSVSENESVGGSVVLHGDIDSARGILCEEVSSGAGLVMHGMGCIWVAG